MRSFLEDWSGRLEWKIGDMSASIVTLFTEMRQSKQDHAKLQLVLKGTGLVLETLLKKSMSRKPDTKPSAKSG